MKSEGQKTKSRRMTTSRNSSAMASNKPELRIAIPNKGRLKQPAIDLLRNAGLRIGANEEKSLFIKTGNPDIDIITIRVEDIPRFVEEGAADIGIVGRDIARESRAKVEDVMGLNFGYCSLVLACPDKSAIRSVSDLRDGVRVATKFVNLTRAYFRKIGKKAELVRLSGAVELAPMISLADVIVDLTSTGSTLKTHGLRPIATILESEAIIIKNPSYGTPLLDDLILAIHGVVSAQRKKYLVVNLPEKRLPDLEKLCSGLFSPTITRLDKPGWIAAQMVVDESSIFDTIKGLKGIGGRDILVLPIERLVR